MLSEVEVSLIFFGDDNTIRKVRFFDSASLRLE